MEDLNQKTIGQYFSALSQKTPVEWERLPDIGLYMDQVVTYLERQLEIFRKPGDDSLITPSMINNYAKAKIVPRTEGKKYGQEHIALLMAVFTLKRVLSVQDMVSLFGGSSDLGKAKEFYGQFRQSLERAIGDTAEAVRSGLLGPIDGTNAGGMHSSAQMPPDGGQGVDKRALRGLALELAVEASMRSFAAELLLSVANPENPEMEKESIAPNPKERKARKKDNKKASN
ncbi:MAG: DUF1836 domain-containing protein [Spirochaetales bacterium]|jgi:hypothetical protein